MGPGPPLKALMCSRGAANVLPVGCFQTGVIATGSNDAPLGDMCHQYGIEGIRGAYFSNWEELRVLRHYPGLGFIAVCLSTPREKQID